jgi:hypothetical protein
MGDADEGAVPAVDALSVGDEDDDADGDEDEDAGTLVVGAMGSDSARSGSTDMDTCAGCRAETAPDCAYSDSGGDVT